MCCLIYHLATLGVEEAAALAVAGGAARALRQALDEARARVGGDASSACDDSSLCISTLRKKRATLTRAGGGGVDTRANGAERSTKCAGALCSERLLHAAAVRYKFTRMPPMGAVMTWQGRILRKGTVLARACLPGGAGRGWA